MKSLTAETQLPQWAPVLKMMYGIVYVENKVWFGTRSNPEWWMEMWSVYPQWTDIGETFMIVGTQFPFRILAFYSK